jgi:HAE1 family hydrophobic/amphiphilic exporter-1
MWLLGYTLNLMTLLAMSLIIGILVDDAVVVLENIQKHLDKGKDKRLLQWMANGNWLCGIVNYIS